MADEENVTVGIRKKKQLKKYESIETNIEVSNVSTTRKDIRKEIEELRDIIRDQVNQEIAIHKKESSKDGN